MMTYDDRGEGGLRIDDIINKGSFLEQYPKKITQYPLFLCLEYSAFQIPIGLGILFKKHDSQKDVLFEVKIPRITE